MMQAFWAATALMLGAVAMDAQAPARPFTAKTTSVLVNLSVKPGMLPKLEPLMLDEVSDTVQAYLDGKILQWWSKADGTGVMFILNATSVADAQAIMGSLPLDKAGIVDLQFTPLAPLQPLKRLIVAAKK